MSRNMLLPRFLGAAALASVIAGVLVGFNWGHTADSRLVRVTPASPAMMQLLRDERYAANTIEEMQKHLRGYRDNMRVEIEAGTR